MRISFHNPSAASDRVMSGLSLLSVVVLTFQGHCPDAGGFSFCCHGAATIRGGHRPRQTIGGFGAFS